MKQTTTNMIAKANPLTTLILLGWLVALAVVSPVQAAYPLIDTWSVTAPLVGLLGNYPITSSKISVQSTAATTYTPNSVSPALLFQAWNCSVIPCASQVLECTAGNCAASGNSLPFIATADASVPDTTYGSQVWDSFAGNQTAVLLVQGATPYSIGYLGVSLNSATNTLTRTVIDSRSYQASGLGENQLLPYSHTITAMTSSAVTVTNYTTASMQYALTTGTNVVFAVLQTGRFQPTASTAKAKFPLFFQSTAPLREWVINAGPGNTVPCQNFYRMNFIVASPDDRHVYLFYITSPSSGAMTLYVTMGTVDPSATRDTTYTYAYNANSVGGPYPSGDQFVWTDSRVVVPNRQSIAAATTAQCVAIGRPGGDGGSFPYGSVTILCLTGGHWVRSQSAFAPATNADQFGTCIQWSSDDTIVAISAPGAQTIYLFSWDPVGLALNTNPFDSYTYTADGMFGTSFAFNSQMMLVSSYAGGGFGTGAAYIFANQTACVVSAYVPQGGCSVACGNGTQNAIATVLVQPTFGAVCPPLINTSYPCTAYNCSMDCVVSQFVVVTTCNASCGFGSVQLNRTIVSQPVFGGAACPSLVSYSPCYAGPCDCVVSNFTFTSCNASCGGGYGNATRYVITPPQANGAPCPNLTALLPCNTTACNQVWFTMISGVSRHLNERLFDCS